jgi:signal transduction histidine kinase
MERYTNKSNRIPLLKGLSIRKQLPLLICLLLLVIILLFGAISYWSMRTAALDVGRQRLRSLTGQLASLFQQSAHTLIANEKTAAGGPDISHYLDASPQAPADSGKTLVSLRKMLGDGRIVRAEIRDPRGNVLLHAGRYLNFPADPAATDSNFVGPFRISGDSLYYPIAAVVKKDGKRLGYLFQWQPIRATQRSMAQLSQLLGGKATIYLGNMDGSSWSDMLHPIPDPVPAGARSGIAAYDRPGGHVIGYALAIPGTPWMTMVELSQDYILEAANRFLYWMIGIGTFLILAGSFIAWLISRSFTRPLNRLMLATSELARGNYAHPVAIHRRDELGRLAASFHSMATQVQHTHDELENKVRDRTRELEAVNKELEAFSYSVSHDLRAPLRAVSGYTMMLKEDYEDSFDEEAKRITGNILANVKMMGRLIDDLIAFSHLGKKEPRLMITDMQQLAETCIAELTPAWPMQQFRIDIDPLPACLGDKDLLKQVWLNLIGNALKYSSKKNAPQITIGSTIGDGNITYFVRDNGAGFDSRYADKLFKVFQRLHSQEEFEGTGIGLALVKRILDKHKGRIWAESSPGSGAVFCFQLKAQPVQNEHQSFEYA